MKSVIRDLRTKSFVERWDFMVYEWLGTKNVGDGKKEYSSEKDPEKKEKKSGRYEEILQIFHMTVMLLGILMEKISRIQAAGGAWAEIFGTYVTAVKGNRACRNKVRYIVNKNGSGHAVTPVVAGGNNGMVRRAGKSGFYPRQAILPGKRTAGNKYRDRRLLVGFPEISTDSETQKRNRCYVYRGRNRNKYIYGAEKRRHRIRDYPDSVSAERDLYKNKIA